MGLLTQKEKIDVLKKAKVIVKAKEFICRAIDYIIRTEFNINTNAIEVIPELLKYKPNNKLSSNSWFGIPDKFNLPIRLDVIDNVIKDIEKNIIDGNKSDIEG